MTGKSQPEQITKLIHQSDITNVVNNYFRALDEKNFDSKHFATIFTAAAKIVRPNGTAMIGPKMISDSHRASFDRFESTQHILTGHDVNIDGDSAAIRINLVAMHLWKEGNANVNQLDNFFVAGGVIIAQLLYTDGLWKISAMNNTIKWRAGAFKNMELTDKL